MNEFVELRYLLTLLLKRWPVILLGALLGAGLSLGISQQMSPVYEATATLLVGQPIQAPNVDSRDIQTSEQLAFTYAEIGRRQSVLQRAVEALDLDITWRQLQERVRFRPVEGTQLLDVIVEAGSREEARRTADELARQLILLSSVSEQDEASDETSQFIRQRLESLRERIATGQARVSELEAALASETAVDEMGRIQDELDDLERLITDWESSYAQLLALVDGGQSASLLEVIEPAHVELSPVWPRINLNILLGTVLGVLLATGIIVWRDYWDESLRSVDDLGHDLGLPPLGTVSKIKGRHYHDKLITSLAPFSPASEAYRMIRSSIRFICEESPCRTILVTSGTFGEGKSLTVANLGLVMAQAGHKTIIVDADLRRPVQHRIFGVTNEGGLTELLRTQAFDFEEQIQETGTESLSLLTSGASTANPSELLSSDYTELLLSALAEDADTVILDGPPVLSATDAALLASLVDGVVVVVESGRTEWQALGRTVTILQQAGANLLGAVLNRVSHKSGAYYYQSYHPDEQGDDGRSGRSSWWRLPIRTTRASNGTSETIGNGTGAGAKLSQ